MLFLPLDRSYTNISSRTCPGSVSADACVSLLLQKYKFQSTKVLHFNVNNILWLNVKFIQIVFFASDTVFSFFFLFLQGQDCKYGKPSHKKQSFGSGSMKFLLTRQKILFKVLFSRIRIHETFDDMAPDPVTKPTQIMDKYFFFSQIKSNLVFNKNICIMQRIQNLAGGGGY